MNQKHIDIIAKQWDKISNKEISESYNNGKIANFGDIDDIKILKQSKYTFIMMTQKTKTPSKIDILIDEFHNFKKEMLEFKKDVTTRLDGYDNMFKQHGWIK